MAGRPVHALKDLRVQRVKKACADAILSPAETVDVVRTFLAAFNATAHLNMEATHAAIASMVVGVFVDCRQTTANVLAISLVFAMLTVMSLPASVRQGLLAKIAPSPKRPLHHRVLQIHVKMVAPVKL
ncbi:hypothetical protein TELCIR_06135 [Teladorsagia circumcincta]|uniref:Uncharacterized protein n=1 Tax=Teladorsagia circumcincta TaxID=45464 RepID=A0A2G9UNY8_TELCI|nr:hypothetical protein TELCIR_06135 [Teladorsagia circumcincta]